MSTEAERGKLMDEAKQGPVDVDGGRAGEVNGRGLAGEVDIDGGRAGEVDMMPKRGKLMIRGRAGEVDGTNIFVFRFLSFLLFMTNQAPSVYDSMDRGQAAKRRTRVPRGLFIFMAQTDAGPKSPFRELSESSTHSAVALDVAD